MIFVSHVLTVIWSGSQQEPPTNNSNDFCLYVPSLVSEKMIFFMVAEKVIQSKTKILWVKILGQREIAREGNGG